MSACSKTSNVKTLNVPSFPESPLPYWFKCITNAGANFGSHETRQLQLAMHNGSNPSHDRHSLLMQQTHGAVLAAVNLAHEAVRAAEASAVTAAAHAKAAEASADSATAAAAAKAAATAAKTTAAAATKAAKAAVIGVLDVQDKLEIVMLMAMVAPHEDQDNIAISRIMAYLTGGPTAGNAALDEAMPRLRPGS